MWNEQLETKLLMSPPVRDLLRYLFGNKKLVTIKRPACIIVRLSKESGSRKVRVIILPPRGYTSNSMDEASSHPETRKATILVKGAVRQGKAAFSVLRSLVKVIHFDKSSVKTKFSVPYVKINKQQRNVGIVVSAKEKIYVVKENGWGFYHNIINLSDEWLVLVLDKELRPQKRFNMNIINAIGYKNKKVLKEFFNKVQALGDSVFKIEGRLISKVIKFKPQESIPILIQMLNIDETGKHEPCTVYALILKIGRKYKVTTLRLLHEAVISKVAPRYYLDELIVKLSRLE